MNSDIEDDSISSTSESSQSVDALATIQDEYDLIPDHKTLNHLKQGQHVPQLEGYENLEAWDNDLYDALQIFGVYELFSQVKTPPADPVKARRWMRANSWIRQFLLKSISPELIRQQQLTRVTNSAEMYERVKEHVMSIGRNCLSEIQYKWNHLKYTNFNDTIGRIYELKCHIETVTQSRLSNEELVDKLIKVVPAKWQSSAVDAKYTNPNIEFEDLVRRLRFRQYMEQLRKMRERGAFKLLPQPSTNCKAKSFAEEGSQPSEVDKNKMHCNTCKKNGHTEEKCFKNEKCFKCDTVGHIAKFCRNKLIDKSEKGGKHEKEKAEKEAEKDDSKDKRSSSLFCLDEVRMNDLKTLVLHGELQMTNRGLPSTPNWSGQKFHVANGEASYAKGTVRAEVLNDGKWDAIEMKEVYFVPNPNPFNLWNANPLMKSGTCKK